MTYSRMAFFSRPCVLANLPASATHAPHTPESRVPTARQHYVQEPRHAWRTLALSAPRHRGHPRTHGDGSHAQAPEGHTATEPHAVTLMPSLSWSWRHAHAAKLSQPDARAQAVKRRPRQEHALENRLCQTPLQFLRAREKIAPSQLAQAGRQRVRTGIQQQHACSGWVRPASVAPRSSTLPRR